MSIKKIDQISESLQDQRVTYREMIKNDIQEALDNHVEQFEFEGNYNWKYLPQYAREEAQRLFRRKYYMPIIYRVNAELKQKYNVKYIVSPGDWTYRDRFIKVSSRKMEDRVHVYAKIDFAFIDRFADILYEDMEDKAIQALERELKVGAKNDQPV